MASQAHITPIRIASLIRDPFVRAAFERADRDRENPITVPVDPPRPVLNGGAVEEAAYA